MTDKSRDEGAPPAQEVRVEPYEGSAGGWGSMASLVRTLGRTRAASGLAALPRQNKPGGFACVSCAWAKPAHPHVAEFCENGAKATFWELTPDRAGPEFFARHSLSDLRQRDDYRLEMAGRLTEPMRYDPATDRYVAASWEQAFAEIGAELIRLRAEDPANAVFYASGRAGLETSYMWQLLARMHGNNNLPDSSNMCHESTSVGLKASIGSPVGTVTLQHFAETEALFFFGQNVGSNAPRMLHQLQEARRRGAAVVSFNPLRERGLERFANPQEVGQMLTGSATPISGLYAQLRPGSDIAAVAGMAKWLIAEDAVDHDFIAAHTEGYAGFAAWAAALDWADLERETGLPRATMMEAARLYAQAGSAIIVYGMGITQHRHGVAAVQMLVNLALLRGNIGRPGAGICPVRGHSNVQGQRTVGITEKPELAPLDRLAELYDFAPPRERGVTTVEACEGIIDGRIRAFLGLGGNFLRAVPERERMEEAWLRLRLAVHVATKLNRGHLFPAEVTWLLPCLGRTEREPDGRAQLVSIEDSISCIHASSGTRPGAGPALLTEHAIVSGIAQVALAPNAKVPWADWAADLSRVRAAIEATWPQIFAGYEQRMHIPGGFRKPVKADQRIWETESGKAQFVLPPALHASFDDGGAGVFRLMTLRSNDQFNTTVYGYDDRFRGIHGSRMVVFMNAADMARLGIAEGVEIGMESAADDGFARRMHGFRATAYDMPEGSLGAYYPECNALIPLWQHAEQSQVPAAKSVPVRILA